MVNEAQHDPEAVRHLLAKALASVRGGDAEAVYTARDFGLTLPMTAAPESRPPTDSMTRGCATW